MFEIKVTGDKELRRFLKGIKINIPKGVERAMDEWGVGLQRDLKRISPVWRGDLKDSIKWSKRSKGGQLEVAAHGLTLEFMRPHKVSFATSPKLHQWALDHSFQKPELEQMGGIYVKPKVWFTPTMENKLNILTQQLSKATSRAIRRTK